MSLLAGRTADNGAPAARWQGKGEFPVRARPVHPPTVAALIRVPTRAALFVALALATAAAVPCQLSLLAVVLLAGPHNWMELRYFLTHMPARWGPQRDWFRLALGGAALLASSWLAGTWIGVRIEDDGTFWTTWSTAWTVSLTLWIALLVDVQARCKHRLRPIFTWPAALTAIGLLCSVNLPWDLALVYLHPLIALAFLDRELRRLPALRRTFRRALLVLPPAILALWYGATVTPPVFVSGTLDRVTALAGAELLPGVSPQRLVALYVFLQMLHYGAWIVAIPALRLRRPPYETAGIPLVKRFPRAVPGLLVFGATTVVALWSGFAISLQTTWDIYFQVAILHVIAEFPFLVRKFS